MSLLTKIAHNNRVSLATRDIKQLQEIISSERRLVEQTQRLAADRDKASVTLREWGNAEGPDLGDVLGKVSVLLEYLSKAEMTFAEHNGSYRLRFKEIRSKEESLSALKKSRDSLAGRIDAQERKVSKMKEENKDLPAQRQRLRDMQQEMIGLENSLLTEETRLGDFKRTATREALSLKLGAMLELAEKTVIVAELGKLIVDMLPVDETEPGQPRAFYEGHQRTEELLGEAQRCLQDVVFNPAPLTEGSSHPPQRQLAMGQYSEDRQQEYGEGASHPTDQFNDSGIRAVQPASDFGTPLQSGSHYAEHSYSSYPSHAQPEAQGTQPGPQLQPLPDFRPLSVVGEPGKGVEGSSGRPPYYGHEVTSQHETVSPRSPASTTRYQPQASMLAAPVHDDRYNPDRSSLAYMDDAPLTNAHHQREPAVQENHPSHLDGQAHMRRISEQEVQRQRESDPGSRQQYQPETQYEAYPYSSPDAGQTGLAPYPVAGEGEDDVARRDMHGEPLVGHPASGPLSPVTEVPTPAPDQLEAGADHPFAQEHGQDTVALGTHSQPGSSQGHDTAERTHSPFAESRTPLAAVQQVEPHSPVAPSATPVYAAHSQLRAPDAVPDVPSGPTSPVNSAFIQQPRPPPAASAFEPAPFIPKPGNERRPNQNRAPQGEVALGSKYGDVFVPGRAAGEGGPYSPGSASQRTNPADAGLSGYFAPPSSTGPPLTPGAGGSGADQKRTIAASAFRRPQQQQVPYSAPSAGGSRFAASGYQYDAAAAAAQAAELGPSESERIAAQWRDAATPEQREQAQTKGYGAQGGHVPSFDTRPLQVNKQRQGSLPGPGAVGRSGTMPSNMYGSHGRAPSLGAVESSMYGEPRPTSDALPRPAPPVGYVPTGPNDYTSADSQGGFASSRFVTRLD